MARHWRALAAVGDQTQREQRLRLAEGMEKLAGKLDREPGKDAAE